MILNGVGFTDLQSLFSFRFQLVIVELKPFIRALHAVPDCSQEEVNS